MYTIITNLVNESLLSTELNPIIGFLHKNSFGRPSLACDLVEELSPFLVDRFVLRLINSFLIRSYMFNEKNSHIIMEKEALQVIFREWNVFLEETIHHKYLDKNVPKALLPNLQATILSYFIKKGKTEYHNF